MHKTADVYTFYLDPLTSVNSNLRQNRDLAVGEQEFLKLFRALQAGNKSLYKLKHTTSTIKAVLNTKQIKHR